MIDVRLEPSFASFHEQLQPGRGNRASCHLHLFFKQPKLVPLLPNTMFDSPID